MSFCPTYAVTTEVFKKIDKWLNSGRDRLDLKGFSGIGKSFSLVLFKVLENDIIDSKFKIRLLSDLGKMSDEPY